MSFQNAQNTARTFIRDSFDGKGLTTEESIINAHLTQPDQVDSTLTFLMGREDKRIPLSFMSEGKHPSKPIKSADGQYFYDVINKLDKADVVISTTYGALDKPGLVTGGSVSTFYVTFRSDWFKRQHIIESKNGVQCRIRSMVKVGLYFKYELELVGDGRFPFCPLSELQPGTTWAMVGGAPVSKALSMGNESNFVTPGKMKNQLTLLRKSWRIGGNVSNKTVNFEFNIDGKKTNYWIAFEQWQFIKRWKIEVEEHYWFSRYNRQPDGSIPNIDPETGLPIPMGAGIDDQITNRDTYSKLTARKLKDTTRDAMFGASDTENFNLILFTGLGGLEEFDEAMKTDAKALGLTQVQGDKFIKGSGYNMTYGGYFAVYEHVDGHKITVQHLPLLDDGSRAMKAARHPRTNLPMTSYEMYFVDMSTYDGIPNIQTYHEEGRAMKTGILQGMADTPYNFGGNGKTNINLATEQDASSIHFMCSKSIAIRRNTHCFHLSCDLA
jgi:hypothetical protein